MFLYGSSLSPFVRKVLVFAAEKGIQIELRPVRLGDADPDFRRASPFGKMPALVDGDYALADSSAIVHYLEAKVPEPPLIPPEARARGRVIWIEEFADTLLMSCAGKMFFNRVVSPKFLKRPGDTEVADTAERDELPRVLDYLESIVPADGYLVGDMLTLADIAVASPLANFAYMDVRLDATRYPKTIAFVERLLARPSFAHWLEREQRLLERAAMV